MWSDFIFVLKDFRLLNVFCLEDVQVYKHQVQKKYLSRGFKKDRFDHLILSYVAEEFSVKGRVIFRYGEGLVDLKALWNLRIHWGTPRPPPFKSVRFECILSTLYCNFHKEDRLGGWGTEGPKAPTLGRHVSACATILRLRALLYLGCVRYYT